MKILYASNPDEMSRKAANIIAAQVVLKPESVLGLATGSSPLGIYRNLIEMNKNGDVDFSKCRSVNLDEYVGLTADNDQSYAYFMHHNFFDHINIDPKNTNLPDGTNLDAEAECARYNKVVASMNGVDIQLLGIGHDGHIGFNEPCDSFVPLTHKVSLTKQTIEANARFFAKESDVPTSAYTMGIKTIMDAHKVLLIAYGKDKAEIVYKMACGPIMPQVPASVLQLHSDCIIVADKEALSVLLEKAPELVDGAPRK